MSTFHRQVVATTVVSEFDINAFVDFASHLADVSGAICRQYFRQELKIQAKPDDSPVTEADVAVEHAIRAELALHFPKHSIFGEELGFSMGEDEDRRFLWVIDPIDGTRSFLTGKPTPLKIRSKHVLRKTDVLYVDLLGVRRSSSRGSHRSTDSA